MTLRKGQLKTSDQAKTTKKQHTKPCSDCPWSRNAIPGWLAQSTPIEWLEYAHGETLLECHTLLPWQCAGAAIYRANTWKVPRDEHQLRLPADRIRVFANQQEFYDHHKTELFAVTIVGKKP